MAEKLFFIKATLNSLFACNYYKFNNMDNLESFLKNYDLINFKMNKDESLQKELQLDDDKFKYYCFGVKTIIKMYQKEIKSNREQGLVSTLLFKSIKTTPKKNQ